jgi:hypothetical protein
MADQMEQIALSELNRLWRDVVVKLRPLANQRPPAQNLKKASYYAPGLWADFHERMIVRLKEAIESGFVSLLALDNEYLEALFGAPLVIDSEAFAASFEPFLATRITQVTETLKRAVARKITRWYNTPGASMKDIVDALAPDFGLSRAHLIAQTEIASLNSAVQEKIAVSIGVTEFWWNTMRDQSVCKRPLRGPDGAMYKGCHALHGQVFKIGMKMPPGHPMCRCSPILIMPKLVKP